MQAYICIYIFYLSLIMWLNKKNYKFANIKNEKVHGEALNHRCE